jgi:hypothetical protein
MAFAGGDLRQALAVGILSWPATSIIRRRPTGCRSGRIEQAGYDPPPAAPQFPKEGPIHVLIGIWSGPGLGEPRRRHRRFMDDPKAANPGRGVTYEDRQRSDFDHWSARRRLRTDHADPAISTLLPAGAVSCAIWVKPGEILLACLIWCRW